MFAGGDDFVAVILGTELDLVLTDFSMVRGCEIVVKGSGLFFEDGTVSSQCSRISLSAKKAVNETCGFSSEAEELRSANILKEIHQRSVLRNHTDSLSAIRRRNLQSRRRSSDIASIFRRSHRPRLYHQSNERKKKETKNGKKLQRKMKKAGRQTWISKTRREGSENF